MEIKYAKGAWTVWPTDKVKLPGSYTSRHMAETAARSYKIREELAKEKRRTKKKED